MRFALAAITGGLILLAPSVRAGDLGRGKRVYEANCIRCHTKTAEGSALMAQKYQVSRSSMDLTGQAVRDTDDKFLVAFISQGKGHMPAFAKQLTTEQIEDVLAYVRSLRGRALGFGTMAAGDVDAELSAKRFVANCAYCHGKSGKGNPGMAKVFKVEQHSMDLTSPEVEALSDADLMALISQGKERHMPAFGETLSQDEIRGLMSHVRSLKGDQAH